MLALLPPYIHLPHFSPQEHDKLPKRKKESNHILHFHQLLSRGSLTLTQLNFPLLFKSCTKLFAVGEGRQLHGQAIKRGFHCDVFVQRSLIRMYSKCLACRDAMNVFDRCSDPDVASYNDLIIGLSRMGDLNTADKIFNGMDEKNVVSWSVMVDGYVRNGQMEIAQNLFDSMPERNQFAWNSLISGYLRSGRVEAARKIFDQMVPDWNVVTWTAMISGYVQNCEFKKALDLFVDMQIAGVAPNEVTFVSILPAVTHLGALSQGRWIHAYIDKMGMEVDSALGSALVDMYSKCGCIEDALIVFKRLKYKELSAWNSLIFGLGSHGRGRDALRFFARMRNEPLMVPNDITFVAVLNACSHSGLVDEGWAVFDIFINYYKLTPNVRHYGCMVDMLGRAGLVEEALELVAKMPVEPNSVIWKVLLSACKVHKNIRLADRILAKSSELGHQDSGFYSLASSILSDAGRWHDASKVRREMNDLQVQKTAGCSWLEVDGVVHEFLSGKESFHDHSREVVCVLYEMESLMKLEASMLTL